MNTVDLFLIHVVFIVACVYFSYRSGQKSGRSEMVTDLIDRNMVTVEKLRKEYETHCLRRERGRSATSAATSETSC